MKPALLIVDDDEDIRTQLKWALCDDYTIFLAEDRASAVEHLRTQRPAVVLLDLGLPPHPATPEEGFAILAQILDTKAGPKSSFSAVRQNEPTACERWVKGPTIFSASRRIWMS